MRKIIQICAIPNGSTYPNKDTLMYNRQALYALCNDGTIWLRKEDESTWTKLPDIPQPPLGECTACHEKRGYNYISWRLPGVKLCQKCFDKEFDNLWRLQK